jgi:hypothetical protein
MIRNGLRFLFFAAFTAFANPAHAVFIGDDLADLYVLDIGTNTATFIGNMGLPMLDIAQDPTTGALYGAGDDDSLYSINPNTAASTYIGDIGLFVNGLTFDAAGTLYGSGFTNLFTIDTGTGMATSVGDTGFTSSGDLAFDADGTLFMSALGGTSDQLVSLDLTDGMGTSIGDIGFEGVLGLNFEEGTLYGFTDFAETITIDTTTGAGTLVEDFNGIFAYGAGGVQVPEPATLGVLGVGLLGLGFATYRRRRQDA